MTLIKVVIYLDLRYLLLAFSILNGNLISLINETCDGAILRHYGCCEKHIKSITANLKANISSYTKL